MFKNIISKQAKYLCQLAQSNPGHSAKLLAEAKIDYEDFTDIVSFNEAIVEAITDIANDYGVRI